jgi:hypothetical protein
MEALPYVQSVHTANVGGGEVATFVNLKGGRCLVLAFNLVGLYDSEEAYWTCDDDPDEPGRGLVWLSADEACEP